ncbi:MAG TPA: adenosine deaminase [Candidatus Saccharimonadales bacterium]|nr:adenosine deaminase [Candidatus Saccharimonadales bacterium]
MPVTPVAQHIASLPKAELHLHLEGSIHPATVSALTVRRGAPLGEEQVRQRYTYSNFLSFLETFKWITSLLVEPRDYALITEDLAEHLLSQNVVYAEVTLSIGVMLFRKQDPQANFAAIREAAEPFKSRGLNLKWIFDAVRHFGVDAAMRVVDSARACACPDLVAFGMGGDELSVATADFAPVYERATAVGLHRLIHAGEVGGPEKIREAIEVLGVERIGHGIAAIRDPALMDLLAERQIPLEICPESNILTGALGRQLGLPEATIEQHPLPKLFRHGIPVVLSTDDPTMFHTTLGHEYENAARMGLSERELLRLVAMSFRHAFSLGGTSAAT